MYFNIYSIPVVIAGFIMFLIAVVIRKYKHIPGVNCFTLLMLAGLVYSLFYTLEISTTQLQLVTMFYKLEYLGIPLIPAFYLLFAIRYSGLKENPGPLLIVLIFLIPVFTMLMVFTNSYHHLFISDSYIDFQAWYPSHGFKPGFFYWLHQIYTIIAFIISFVLFLKLFVVSAPAFRKQVSIIILASVVPFLIYVSYLTGAFPYGLDPIPFAFAIAGLIVYAGLHYFRLFDLTPLARNLLFEKIPNAVVIFDERFRLVDFNQSAAALFGFYPKIIGKPHSIVFTQHPVVQGLLDKPVSEDVEMVHIEKNNTILYFSCTRSLITDDVNIARGTMLIMQDVTLQHTLEINRRETEEKFRLIFENTPLGVFYYDKNGVIRVCNDYFINIIGSDREKLIGLNMQHLPDKRVVSALQNALEGKRGFFEGVYHSVTAAKVTPVRMLLEAIRNPDGQVEGGLGIVEDITERIENEEKIKNHNQELQRLNAEKDRFFSIIAHDLRSPFNSFLGYTQLMTEETDNFSKDELISFAQEIRKSAVVLFGLLENLLEWARLQQQTIVMEQKPVKLHQIVAQSILFSTKLPKARKLR
jgi:PAS domain S-box-containing protein